MRKLTIETLYPLHHIPTTVIVDITCSESGPAGTLAEKSKETKRFLGVLLLSLGLVTTGSVSAVQAQTFDVRPIESSQDPAASSPRRDPARPQPLHSESARPPRFEDEEDMQQLLSKHYADLRERGMDPEEDLRLDDLGFRVAEISRQGMPRPVSQKRLYPLSSLDPLSSLGSIEESDREETKVLGSEAYWSWSRIENAEPAVAFVPGETKFEGEILASPSLFGAYLQDSKEDKGGLGQEDVQEALDALKNLHIINEDQYESIHRIAEDHSG